MRSRPELPEGQDQSVGIVIFTRDKNPAGRLDLFFADVCSVHHDRHWRGLPDTSDRVRHIYIVGVFVQIQHARIRWVQMCKRQHESLRSRKFPHNIALMPKELRQDFTEYLT